MKDYLERFEAMVKELRAHPEVVVTHFNIRKAAHSLMLRKAISMAGIELPKSLVAFYQACDGLQFRWIHKRAEGYDLDVDYDFTDTPFDLQFPPDEDGQATGCVNILPLSWVFSEASMWEGIIWRHTTNNKDRVEFGRKEYPRLDFLQSVRPFDQFDAYYNMAFVFAAKDANQIPLVMGKNNHSDYSSSLFVDVETYFEFLLKTKCLVAARPRHFSAALSTGAPPSFDMEGLAEVPNLDLGGNDFDE